jgi:hypothetical protein
VRLIARRHQPGFTVELPQNLPIDLPKSVSVTVPEGAAEAVGSAVASVSVPAVRVPDALRTIEVPRDLPAKIGERLPSLARGIRLPRLGRLPSSLAELESLLHIREREIRALQARSNRNLAVGLAVGTMAGAAIILALLPDRTARIAEIRAQLGGLDAPAEYVEDARRIATRARESLAERIRIAKEEARQVQEETKRELWARFEVAKRDGHQPPMA